MAEAIGLVLAFVGAFNDAIQCYEYVQIGHNYDKDFQTAVLKLDVAQLRLSRWGFALGLNHADPADPKSLPTFPGSDKDVKTATELLVQIVDLFDEAQHRSSKLKPSSDQVTIVDPHDQFDANTKSLRKKLKSLSLKRFKPKNLGNKIKWALNQEKYLNRLIEDITVLVGNLVELFPSTHAKQQELCKEDGKDLADEQAVEDLAPIVKELDPELGKAIASSSEAMSQVFNITFAGSTNWGLQQGYFKGTQTNNFGYRPDVPQSENHP